MTSSLKRTRRLLSSGAAAAAALLWAGCASVGPVALISGKLQTRTALDLEPVMIISIDGESRLDDPSWIDPGVHTIVLQPPPPRGHRFGRQMSLELKVEPCTRYYLAARRSNPLLAEWSPIVERTEPLSPCGAKPAAARAFDAVPAA